MRFTTIVSVVALTMLLADCAQAWQSEVIDVWPSGLPADAKALSKETIKELQAKQDPEHLAYVENPTLAVYLPEKGKANGAAVVICPGGGYNILAWPKEGTELATWFNSHGVAAFVLKYRVPRRDPDKPHWEPMQDFQRSIRIVRHRAAEWQIDPHRIGCMGFSAGGHLIIVAAGHCDEPSYPAVDEADKVSCRPDFLCPIYAAYLGDKYRDDVAELGPLVNITNEFPPTFLAVTWDDRMRGAQSALLFSKLREHNVPAELHVYANGGHGYGLREKTRPVGNWQDRLADWLADSKYLADPKSR